MCWREDLSANPLMRELTSHKKDLDDYLKPFKFEQIANGNTYFTATETDDLKERLTKVEEQLADELKQALTDKIKLKAELKELKEEFNTLKQTIPNLTKANWAKSMISKIYIWSSKKENQKLIAATTKYGQAFLEAAIS
ncbi:MAG: polyhydroxyalkanoate synthesis regulator phasin [Salibacteraceae bacterium]|jgi:polyhydroxyalkanoate synthesis regulator phasin